MALKVFLEGMDLYLGLDQDGTQKFNEALEYDNEFSLAYIMPVSYTHLTLPTNREV